MGKGAAFFDLDRTLLRKASGPVLTEALVSAGVAPDRKVPGVGLVYRLNDVVGESLVGMGLARLKECHRRASEPKLENAVAMMKICIDRLAASRFHNGHNRDGKKYLDWEILFRSVEQMEKWLDDNNHDRAEAAS